MFLQPFIFVGIAVLLWGGVDFFNYFTVGLETFQQSSSTQNEEVSKQLVNAQLHNAVVKTLLGVGMISVKMLKANLKPRSNSKLKTV